MDHVYILLKKDLLTLRRNLVFLCMFFILPCSLMLSFGVLQDAIGNELAEEQHNFIYSKYTKFMHREAFMKSGMDTRPVNRFEVFNLTLLSGCRVIGRRDIGLVTS